MPVIFANPLGFLALLGIPAILLIHFLQRESRRLPISTLFLLEHIDRQSIKGRKFDRLRSSIPLWLQLLSVLILTWLLVQPRWTSERSVQRVVLIIDSSASMAAFKDRLADELTSAIPPLTSAVATTEYRLVESQLRGDNLYSGTEFYGLLTALETWNPSDSAHSPETALRVGRSLAGSEGTLIFVTDYPRETLPFGAAQLSIGSAIDNVGFAGHRIESDGPETSWQVTIRNYSNNPQSRDWLLAAGDQRTAFRTIDLGPGETRILKGKFPAGAEQIQLLIKPDAFPLDDQRFLLIPEAKELTISRTGDANIEAPVAEIIESLPNTPQSAPGETPDLVFATYNPLSPTPIPPRSITFLNQQQVPQAYFSGPIVKSNHRLMKDLDWQGLIAKKTAALPSIEGQTVLLWQGERPLIILRRSEGIRQLIFNFDVLNSNAARLPSFIVLIHRFVNQLRTEKVGSESANVELRQDLKIAINTGDDAANLSLKDGGNVAEIPSTAAGSLKAPNTPGFFEIRQGSELRYLGAGNFADTREADFSEASAYSELKALPAKITENRTVNDPRWQLWLIVILAALLTAWALINRSDQRREPNLRSQA
ncbi:BatA domain-containing protein [Verrucomicrobiales bacterium BCK34]|nr:BatA domain-containing protein [Verrucomicrobiales bacterium BCK34]